MAKITFETNRIEIHGDYLLIAPRGEEHGYGYWHMLSERVFLVENIKNFFKNYPSVEAHQLMIYELHGLNGEAHLTQRAADASPEPLLKNES
jgi:hypothetical protein